MDFLTKIGSVSLLHVAANCTSMVISLVLIGHCKAPLPIFVHCLNNKKFCYSLQNCSEEKNLNQYLFFISLVVITAI